MAALNCRPGDLAILIEDLWMGSPISDERVTFCKAGTIVRCVSLDVDNCWRLEEPRSFAITFTGPVYVVVTGVLTGIRDGVLRPIRNPGDDAVDEMVAKVGPAPMTLTELLRRDEVAHG